MNIILNGELREIENNNRVLDMLELLKIKEKVMAVAVNMNIVKKDDWESFTIKEGDKIELLHFVGGG